MLLTHKGFPEISEKRITAVNELSDEQLRLEIEKGRASRFGENMQPVLRTALKLREETCNAQERQQDIELTVKANEIASSALAEAKKANKSADNARFWSGIAILVSVILALINYFSVK